MNMHDIEANAQIPTTQSTPLRTLSPRHKEIARLLVQGRTAKEISARVGISAERIYQIKSEAIFQAYLRKVEAGAEENTIDVRKAIQEAAPRALEVLETLMETANADSVKYRAASDLLDRAGFGAIEKKATLDLNKLLTEEDVDDIKARYEAAKQAGVVIDVGAENTNGS